MEESAEEAIKEAMAPRWGTVLLKLVDKQEKRHIYTCKTPQQGILQVHVLASGLSPEAERREIEAFTSFAHPGLLTIYDYFPILGEYAGLVQENYSKTLWKEVEIRRTNTYPWKEEEMWGYAKELADVMGFMQWQGRVHGCICPQSLYITWDKHVKVGDWVGSQEQRRAIIGENSLLRQSNCSFKADVYALGLILLNMCLLEWKNRDIFRDINRIRYSEGFKSLLRWMLHDNESERCDFIALYCHFNPELKLETYQEAEEESPDVAEEEIDVNVHRNLAYTVRPSIGQGSRAVGQI